jgi:uncharacterized protein involved in exopolysaccharide biosynthesis
MKDWLERRESCDGEYTSRARAIHQELNVNSAPHAAVPGGSDAISLVAIWNALLEDWKLLTLITFAFTALAVVIALVMTPIYRAETVVTPVDTRANAGGASALLGQLGGLAGLAGINLSGLSGSSNKGRTMIQSRTVMEEFLKRNDLVRLLSERRRAVTPDDPATLWRATEEFKEIYSVDEDEQTGLITVGVEWTDAQTAAKWANGIVKLANELLRQRDLADSQRNIKYLDEQLSKTNVVGLQEAIYNLIEVEMRTLMLANAREEYALSVVDSAEVPELRERPKRKQLVVLGFLLGGIVGCFVVAVRRTFRAQRIRYEAGI